jgi:hypothetical protein
VLEEYPEIPKATKRHGTALSTVVKEAEEAGWILVRCELFPNTYHYLAIFVRKEIFGPEPATAKRVRL